MNIVDFDTVGEPAVMSAATGQELVDELAASGKLDVLFDSIDAVYLSKLTSLGF